MASLPGNQRDYLIVKLEPNKLRCLEDNDMLHTNLLDFIPHSTLHTAMIQTISTTVLLEQLQSNSCHKCQQPNADKKFNNNI